VPYLTPDELPEDGLCRPLFIPNSPEWLAIVSGALTELTFRWNWQQEGSVTVDQAVAAMVDLVDNYYSEACDNCELPEGGSVIRLTADGHIQVLSEGVWVTPEDGDYFIPPPAAREEGTTSEQKCLAAANAVNVLETLYESLSDSWNASLDEAEALTAFIEAATLAVGFAFAPIAFGIAAFFLPIFFAMYALLEFVIADLWDEVVSEQIKCFLYECASNDAGVVTFDYECFLAKMRANINLFDLTEDQLRLYGQIAYLVNFIGGADGLNLAGGTTAITEATCDECATCEDYLDVMDAELGAKTSVAQIDPFNSTLPIIPAVSPTGSYTTGSLGGRTGYIQQGVYDGNPAVAVLIDLGRECLITAYSIETYSTDDVHLCDGFEQHWFLDGDGNQIMSGGGGACWGGDGGWRTLYATGILVTARYLYLGVFGSSGATVAIKEITIVANDP